MIAEVLHSSSVLKLKEILKSRFGLGLEVVSITDITVMDIAEQTTFKTEGCLHVPIVARGKYMGTAVMERADQLSDTDVNAVSEIVRLVLEPALFSFYLSRQTEFIESPKSPEELPENVTPITSFSRTPSEASTPENLTWLLNRPEISVSGILIESYNPHRIQKAALQIHELGERWAFVSWQDIQGEIKSVEDLTSMGPMTILVQDILLLSPEQQRILATYCESANSVTCPLVLFGATRNLFDLMEDHHVHENLGISLMKNRIELDRLPADFSMLKEALELLLDRKALLN